jgi:hypothetical protein
VLLVARLLFSLLLAEFARVYKTTRQKAQERGVLFEAK